MSRAKLYNFTHEEFIRDGRDWWLDMDQGLMVRLDIWRHLWGSEIFISKNRHAIGRRGLQSNLSQHNINVWGSVRAIDTFPSHLNTRSDVDRCLSLARHVGFTGLGIYIGLPSGIMVHTDVRHDRKPGDPATWGRISTQNEDLEWNHEYTSMETVLNMIQ